MVLTRFKDGGVHFRNSGMKGLKSEPEIAIYNYIETVLPTLLNRNGRKRTFWYVRPTKTQLRLRIRAVWSEPSLSISRKFASLFIQNAPNEDSDQTVQMRSLIWIFAGTHVSRYVSWLCGSIHLWSPSKYLRAMSSITPASLIHVTV